MRPIVLLDLNYTLCENSASKQAVMARSGYAAWLDEETYRAWLVDVLRPYHVILITARPDRWREKTLARIQQVTDWLPQEALFMTRDLPPPQLKQWLFEKHVKPKHPGARFAALESNAQTRAMYKKLAIPAEPARDAALTRTFLRSVERQGSLFT